MLQPFRPLLIEIRGNRELRNLATVEAAGMPHRLKGNRQVCAFYANELLMRLVVRDDPHPHLYDEYKLLLGKLEDEDHYESALRYFELVVLEELGYGLNLTEEYLTGLSIKEGEWYRYRPEEGARRVEAAESDYPVVSGETLLKLRERRLDTNQSQREAKLLLKNILSHYLGDKPLKSRELYVSSKKLQNC
ncbi:MAG: DNA repair protein RecO [Gammaproteobacteria bacterium]